MKHFTISVIALSLVALLLGACVTVPIPAMGGPTAAPIVPVQSTAAPGPASDWQTYADAEVGFSIQIPATWSSEPLPDQNNGAIHGTAFTGPQGGVEVYWGVGFGGACPQGTEPVQLAQGEVQACHGTTPEGTEVWSQIGYEVSGGNSFSVRAYTSDAQPSSHDLVLQVLATLTFMPPAQPQAGASIANPASQNCIALGGVLSIEERGDGGQFGVCYFEDNRQCEEWALLHGDCPVGGVKVTGYVTPAARYCAITGGEYAITGNGGAEDEQGTCTFKDGSQCDVWDYYNGTCAPGAVPEATLQPLSSETCAELARSMAQALGVEVTQGEVPITDPVTGESGTACEAASTGTGEQFESPWAVVDALAGMLESQGWTEDPMLAADGPTGTGSGFRKGEGVCLASAVWWPDASADCPEDQPISACEVTPEQQLYTVTLDCASKIPAGSGQAVSASTPSASIPQPAPAAPTPATLAATPAQTWEVATLLVAPGEPGRLYALLKDRPGGIYAEPTSGVRLMISDDFAATWAPFQGGLPAPPECMVNVNLDYFTPDALYASTCAGLYVWEGTGWAKRSDQLTDVIAVVYGQPDQVWAAVHWEEALSGDDVIRSDDGGRTWRDATRSGLNTFGGMANLGIDPRDADILYGIIRPKYAGSYLRRGTSEGDWVTIPTPQDNATIEIGMAIDGDSGALYITTQVPPSGLWISRNPSVPDKDDVQWELIQEFDPTAQVRLLASGWGPQGLALYANIWHLDAPGMGQQSPDALSGLHRSSDGGKTWEALPMP